MISAIQLSYRTSRGSILRRIDLDVEKGETMAVMGMSGAGKTTLLKCMAGLLRPAAGQMLIDGIDIARMPETELDRVRRRIGMVFQYAALFDSLTIYENVAFGLRRHTRMTEEQIREAVAKRLSVVGLPRTETLCPSQLSGGMQKRVGLARALALDPEILLYDEATAGLDPITAAAIAELIVKARDELGVTSVLVSHDIPTIRRVASRIAMIHKGRIIAMGTVEEMDNCPDAAVRQFMDGSSEGPIRITE